ncbi:MAG TPA: 50S ribosomal protein L21 [Candidatus Polarisedimenticolia bacterium]|nr:50S ribosomal protein L21 [Candidatus Polarisedimenticolia bacterium]
MTYAIIDIGGSQQRVSPGDLIRVNRLSTPSPASEKASTQGSTVRIDRVLMIKGDAGVKIGSPLIEGAAVTATIMGDVKGKKVLIFKKKKRKQYRRTRGHRQQYTMLRIDGISPG